MTVFDDTLMKAASTSRALDALPQRKLSAQAFLSKALRNADCTGEDLDALEAKMKRVGAGAAAAFMRQSMKPLDGGHIPEPDKKWQRLSSVYGGPGFAEDLGLLQSSVAVVYALAVRRLIEKRPGHFGTVESFDEYDAEVARLRAELDAACAEMRAVVSGADLVIDDSLPASLRDMGLAKITFRRAPDVVMCGDWPSVLIERSEAQPEAQLGPAAKRKRSRLAA